MRLYTEPQKAAKNINMLLEYLQNEESSKKYIYRGQTKNWPGPLRPSIYRRSIQGSNLYNKKSKEYKHSLRNIGNIFLEMQPNSFINWIIKNYGDGTLYDDEWNFIQQVTNNYEISKLIYSKGYDEVFSSLKPMFRKFPPAERLILWKKLIDERHRAKVREDGFLQAFGYILGMTIAQQYGFASEFLDFTSDLQVAGFFSTHESPRYLKSIQHNESHKNLGVIYRLPVNKSELKHSRIDSYNYYSAPGQINLLDVCMRFEDNSSPELNDQSYAEMDYYSKLAMSSGTLVLTPWKKDIENLSKNYTSLSIKDRIYHYFKLYFFQGGKRFYRLLNMPNGTYDTSRIGRQSSVMVVPDELRTQELNSYREISKVNFQALEDLSSRKDLETFYFNHTTIQPNLGKITREYLWPKENDLYKELSLQLISPASPPWDFDGHIIPKRQDLLDLGYME